MSPIQALVLPVLSLRHSIFIICHYKYNIYFASANRNALVEKKKQALSHQLPEATIKFLYWLLLFDSPADE